MDFCPREPGRSGQGEKRGRALYAHQAIVESWETGDERRAFGAFERRIRTGIDVWYDTISMFYRLQNLLTRFVSHRKWRRYIIRALQGNPYVPENVASTRELLAGMQTAYERVLGDPSSILRPWAMDPERDHSITCPICLGVADHREDERAFVRRRCGTRTAVDGLRTGIAV
jgi:hypothetical protein